MLVSPRFFHALLSIGIALKVFFVYSNIAYAKPHPQMLEVVDNDIADKLEELFHLLLSQIVVPLLC